MSWDLVERGLRAVRTRAPGDVLEVVNRTLAEGADLLAGALEAIPLAVLALVAGLVGWRRGGVVAGTVAGFSVGLFALTELWPAVAATLAVGVVGALVGGVAVVPLVLLLRALRGRRPRRRLRLGVGAIPALTIVAALFVPVFVEVFASDVTPARIVAVGIAVAVLATLALVAHRTAPRAGDWVGSLVMTGVAGSLVVGVVDGHGLGGALARAQAAHDVIAIAQAALCLLLLLAAGLALSVARCAEADVEAQVEREVGAPAPDGDRHTDERLPAGNGHELPSTSGPDRMPERAPTPEPVRTPARAADGSAVEEPA